MSQLPPSKLVEGPEFSDVVLNERAQKLAIAKMRQDRLDRERLEKNIKYGLSVVGSVGLAALGYKYHKERMDAKQTALVLREQAQEGETGRLLITEGGNLLRTGIQAGARLAGTSINASARVAQSNPTLFNTALTLGTLAYLAPRAGVPTSESIAHAVGKGAVQGAVALGTGAAQGLGESVVELGGAAYNAWNPPPTIPPYEEFRAQFPSLRGSDPAYANTVGFAYLPQIPPHLLDDLTEPFKDWVGRHHYIPSGNWVDLKELEKTPLKEWPDEIWENLEHLPKEFVKKVAATIKTTPKGAPTRILQMLGVLKPAGKYQKLLDLANKYNADDK